MGWSYGSQSRCDVKERDFQLHYSVGHEGKFSCEFWEFEFQPICRLRYTNNSNYKSDVMISKRASVWKSVIGELKRTIDDSKIAKEDDTLWPPPDRISQ